MLKKIDTGIFTRYDTSDATVPDIKILSGIVDRSSNLENWLTSAEAKFKADKADPDAAAAYIAAQLVRDALRDNSAHDAALNAIFLGMFLVRMEAKPHEKAAMAGRKSRAGGARGNASPLRETSLQKHDDWLNYANIIGANYRKRGEKLSYRKLAKEVCEYCLKNDGERFSFWTVNSFLQKYFKIVG
jgi:hypothetical protein